MLGSKITVEKKMTGDEKRSKTNMPEMLTPILRIYFIKYLVFGPIYLLHRFLSQPSTLGVKYCDCFSQKARAFLRIWLTMQTAGTMTTTL